MIVRMRSGEPGFAMKDDGTKVPLELGKGYKLGIATYYIDVSMPDAEKFGIHLKWDSSLAASSIAFEDSCFPVFVGEDQATADVSLNDADSGSTLGNWVAEGANGNVYTPSGSGYTVTNSTTIAVTGGTASGTMMNFVNYGGGRRARLKAVVTTGGFLRVSLCGR